MQKIAILYDATQAIISTFDLDEVLNHVTRVLQDYFQVKSVAILLLDSDEQTLHMRTHAGWSEEGVHRSARIGEGLIGTAAKLKRVIYAPEVKQDPRYIRTIPETRSELCLPLVFRDRLLGVLDCQSDQPNYFDPDTIDLLMLFSTQASIALQNARLYMLEQRKAAQLEAINLIAKQTTAVLELQELLQKVCMFLLQSFPVDHVAVLLSEDARLLVRSHRGRLTPRIQEGAALPDIPSLATLALETRKTVIENDVTRVKNYIPGFDETCSEMCIPLISFGELVGVLALESAKTNTFQAGDVDPLESVADICANAIQNARYVDRVKQMAYFDGLTGIYNRRYFETRIIEEIERAQRYRGEMAVIMLDIDKFKKLNDEFGHLLGDEVLRQVCSIFNHQLRKVDVVCRFGGEEFAIIVPQTTGEHAVAVAEKLRTVIESFHFPGVPRPVTITAGVANFPEHGTSRDELVRTADAALYAGKQAGRNRVVVAQVETQLSTPAPTD